MQAGSPQHGSWQGEGAISSPSRLDGAEPDGFRPNPWHGGKVAQRKEFSQRLSSANQVAVDRRSPQASSYVTPGSCLSCHGHAPPLPLPPPFGSFPLPPGTLPSMRGILGPPQSGSSGGNPKQCVVQYENDAEICRRLPSVDGRRRCWESAAEREAYCIKSKGEVGYPPLRK